MGNTVFGRNLAKRRKALGLTQEQLAMRLNVSPQAVSKWENSSYPDGEDHTVGFVEYEEAHLAQINVSQTDV